MRDKVLFGIKGYRKLMVFLGALLLILIATSVSAQAPLTASATATPTSGPAPLLVTFTSTVSGGTAPYTYLWNFGDTTTDTTASPTHTYNTAGTYAVTLTVTDSAVAPASVTVNVGTITVYLGIAISAVPQCGKPPLNVGFTAEASGGVAPYAYTWNFGDGAPAYNTHEPCPFHGYAACGRYTATVSVVDSLGNRGTASIQVTVFDFELNPTADVMYGVAPLRVNFDAGMTFCGPSMQVDACNYEWDFGDGSVQACDKAPQHIYAEEGTYTVTLRVVIDCGSGSFEKTATIVINVVPDPTVIITVPTDYGEWFGPVGIVQSMVLTNSSVSRVDYYIDDYFVGSSTVAPYTLNLDICGASGVYQLTAIAYTTGGSATSKIVNVVISNPTLDGTNFVLKNPYRVKFYGTGFKIGAKLYINGYQVSVTKVLNSTTVIAKGGPSLKALMPKGVPVIVTLENLDGGCTSGVTFQR